MRLYTVMHIRKPFCGKWGILNLWKLRKGLCLPSLKLGVGQTANLINHFAGHSDTKKGHLQLRSSKVVEGRIRWI